MTVTVTIPGTFVWTATLEKTSHQCMVTDWTFDCGGGPRPTDKETVHAVLLYIADVFEIDLAAKSATKGVETPLPENFDAQRATLDTIAIARWRDDL